MKQTRAFKISLLGNKKVSLEKVAKRRLVVSVEAVKPTPEVQHRLSDLATKARKAKEARFLDKYRTHLAA